MVRKLRLKINYDFLLDGEVTSTEESVTTHKLTTKFE